jgi:hypothetical protein
MTLRLVPARDADAQATPDMLARVRSIMAEVDLDCACRGRLDGALERFAELEQRRQRRGLIAHAREQALRIAGLLEFMRELDDIGAGEADVTVFPELACVFDDVAEAARAGSLAMRQATLGP